MSNSIISHSNNAKWILSRIALIRKNSTNLPWWLEGGMMDDVQKTIEDAETGNLPATWKGLLFNLCDTCQGGFDDYLMQLEKVCLYCEETKYRKKVSRDIDFKLLKRFRMLWRIRGHRYASNIYFRRDHENRVMCYNREFHHHYVTREQLDFIYLFYEVLSFSLSNSRNLEEENMKVLKYAAERESWPFSSIFQNVNEDPTFRNIHGIHGNILSLMITRFGQVSTGLALQEIFEHKDSEPLTNVLHMVAIKNPELLHYIVPYFQEKWFIKDIAGNSVLDNALLSKSFIFATCGHLLVQSDDYCLKKIHYYEELPICIVMIETADLSSVYYIMKRMVVPNYLNKINTIRS